LTYRAGSNASSQGSADDLRVDTQPNGHVNGPDSFKRKREPDDDGDHYAKSEPHEVADRVLTVLNRNDMKPDSHKHTNGISQYGPQTYGMTSGVAVHRYPDQHGLPTPDTPNSNGVAHWATTNGSRTHGAVTNGTPTNGATTNGYHHPVNGDAATGPRPRKRNFANRTRTGCRTCRKRKKKCDERKPFCKKLHITLMN
jgi:hypothetical protein